MITAPRQTSTSQPLPQDYLSIQGRTEWDIIQGCLAMIIAYSWVSVHPNIPGPGKPWWMKGLHRLELMFWSIISPELIIFWAARQWLAARDLEERYSNYGWTKAHGFYIQMGGFMLYDGKHAKSVLGPDELDERLNDGSITMSNLTEEELMDSRWIEARVTDCQRPSSFATRPGSSLSALHAERKALL